MTLSANTLFSVVDTRKHRAQLAEADVNHVETVADQYERDRAAAATVAAGLQALRELNHTFTNTLLERSLRSLEEAVSDEHDEVVERVTRYFSSTYNLDLPTYQCLTLLKDTPPEALARAAADWVLAQSERPLGDVGRANAVARFKSGLRTGELSLGNERLRLKDFAYYDGYSTTTLHRNAHERLLQGLALFEYDALKVPDYWADLLPGPYDREAVRFGELYETRRLKKTVGLKFFKNGSVEFLFKSNVERDAFLDRFELRALL